MSIGHTEMSIRPSDKQKCPLDIQMSIRPLDKQKRPLDVQMSLRPLDEWTLSDSKHLSFLSTGGYAQSYYVIIALLSDAVKVTCPLDIQKCLFVHRTNRNVHWTFKCPFVHWTNRNVQWTLKCPFVQWTDGRMDIV